MYTGLIILHVLVAFVMVGVILLQAGKGAEIGAAFGGSSQTVFGARGASTFLGKLTAVAATIFMVTSLSLAIMSKQKNYSSTIGLDKPVAVPSAPPAAPASPVPAAPSTAEPPKDEHGAHNPDAAPSTPPSTNP